MALPAVEAFPCGDLVCWISRVPRTDFADDLSKNMQDLDWLAAATVRHQRADIRYCRNRGYSAGAFRN